MNHLEVVKLLREMADDLELDEKFLQAWRITDSSFHCTRRYEATVRTQHGDAQLCWTINTGVTE